MNKGRINIARWSSNTEPYHGIRIEVVDGESRVHFLQVNMSVEEFALAITGCGERECEFELRGVDTVGKVREHKEEMVEFDRDVIYSRDRDAALLALKSYEVDGWIGDANDAFNHHRQGAISVTRHAVSARIRFTRYVTKGESA